MNKFCEPAAALSAKSFTFGKSLAYGTEELCVSCVIARRGPDGYYRGQVRGRRALPFHLEWALTAIPGTPIGRGPVDAKGQFLIPLSLASDGQPCEFQLRWTTNRPQKPNAVLAGSRPIFSRVPSPAAGWQWTVALRDVRERLQTLLASSMAGARLVPPIPSPAATAGASALSRPAGRVRSCFNPERWWDALGQASASRMFVGRKTEMKALNDAVRSQEKMVCVFGPPGSGKSALVNQWLRESSPRRRIKQVLAHSFEAEPAADRRASVDSFFASALKFFGLDASNTGSPFQRASQLVSAIRQSPMVLVLDGVDAVGNWSESADFAAEGDEHPELTMLLQELSTSNPGTCIFTCQQPPLHLVNARCVELSALPERETAELLRRLGVHGQSAKPGADDPELLEAARSLSRNPLTVSWFGGYVCKVLQGNLREGRLVESRQATDLMSSFEQRFRQTPELAILRLLALSNPLDWATLCMFRGSPVIQGLTDGLAGRTDESLVTALESLRDCRLITLGEDRAATAHDVTRQHFSQQLRTYVVNAWQKGHGRLFDHWQQIAAGTANRDDAAKHWKQALMHGCLAGRYKEALRNVYRDQIVCGGEWLDPEVLRAFQRRPYGVEKDMLNCLELFFKRPWIEVQLGLREDEPWLLEEVGHYLFLLGRPREAADVLRRVLGLYEEQCLWGFAAKVARLCGELYRSIGDLKLAQNFSAKAVGLSEMADQSDRWGVERAAYGEVRLCQGRFAEADEYFRFADGSSRLRGFGALWYCDWLLHPVEAAILERELKLTSAATGNDRSHLLHISTVLERLEQCRRDLEVRPHGYILEGLLDAATGRSVMLASLLDAPHDLQDAGRLLDRGVEQLTRAGQQHWLVSGLLSRAEVQRAIGGTPGFTRAESDLREVLRIAGWAHLRLAEADANLQLARLHIARNQPAEALDALRKARQIVQETGYHRRDREVELIGQWLSEN